MDPPPLPDGREEELGDAIDAFLDEPPSEDGLEQAARDLVYGAERRNGFREQYVVDAEDLRRLARLVDLDSYLEH